MTTTFSLSQLGWSPFLQQQLTLDEWEYQTPARVIAQHRSQLELVSEQGQLHLPITNSLPKLTVGDWILLDRGSFYRELERLSLFSRKASGTKAVKQLIAANVDTAFIVSSLNADFNLNRIERYLALTKEAGAEAVVVLTKADCCDNPMHFVQQVQALEPLLSVVAVNALDPQCVNQLTPWCAKGKTVALLGSSGVGKSTLVNTLVGKQLQHTGEIRVDDSKGRHTTTSRSIHFLDSGGVLLDTPGMRELQLADCKHGLEQTFADITELSTQCRFADCQHSNEPGCAVQAAIDAGQLEQRRLTNYLKLMREQAFNSATIAEKRAHDRNLGRYYRSVLVESKKLKLGKG